MKIKNYTEEQINEVFDEHKSAFYKEQDDETDVEPGDVAGAKRTTESLTKKKKKKPSGAIDVKPGVQPVSQIKENDEDTDIPLNMIPPASKPKAKFKRKATMEKTTSNPETKKFEEFEGTTRPVKSEDLCEACRSKIFG